MSQCYNTIKHEAEAEFTEKRSRFIGHICPVKSEEAAIAYISSIKSKNWDATHNIYAYILREGQIRRYSDDGEPQGTAGIPALEVLIKEEVFDCVLVITRYFGGTMLGAGGLVRAYSHCAKIALDSGTVIKMTLFDVCGLQCDYNQYGKINSLIPLYKGKIIKSDFSSAVTIEFMVPKHLTDAFKKELTEITCGSVFAELYSEQYHEEN